MKSIMLYKPVLLFLCLVFLSACNSGGSSSGSSTPDNEDVERIIKKLCDPLRKVEIYCTDQDASDDTNSDSSTDSGSSQEKPYYRRDWKPGFEITSDESLNNMVQVLDDGTVYAIWVESYYRSSGNNRYLLYAAVFSADITVDSITPQTRTQMLNITRIDDNTPDTTSDSDDPNRDSVHFTTVESSFIVGTSALISSPKLAVTPDGTAFVTWLQNHAIYVSRYDPSADAWSQPHPLSSASYQATRLLVLDSGLVFAFWKQENDQSDDASSRDTSFSLRAARFNPSTATWSKPFDITDDVLHVNADFENTDRGTLFAWESKTNNAPAIAFLTAIDPGIDPISRDKIPNDLLSVAYIDPTSLDVTIDAIDATNDKNNLIATTVQDNDFLIWNEKSESKNDLVTGVYNTGNGWQALPAPAIHTRLSTTTISIASFNNKLHILWSDGGIYLHHSIFNSDGTAQAINNNLSNQNSELKSPYWLFLLQHDATRLYLWMKGTSPFVTDDSYYMEYFDGQWQPKGKRTNKPSPICTIISTSFSSRRNCGIREPEAYYPTGTSMNVTGNYGVAMWNGYRGGGSFISLSTGYKTD